MKILIVENEIYLAQSISAKLTEIGYICESVSTIEEALKGGKYDAILLSTNISGQNFYPVIEKYKGTIILLLISYISQDTVLKPIKEGASDYIQKPFMIEELIRKLEHLKYFYTLQKQNLTYEKYFKYLFQNINFDYNEKKIKLPLFIKTDKREKADNFVYQYAIKTNQFFDFISLSDDNYAEILAEKCDNDCLYLVDFQMLKNQEKTKILNQYKKEKVIICTTNIEDNSSYETLELLSLAQEQEHKNIQSIEEYVKNIIISQQDTFSDTELSKKLGISRKSLWEKRRKYGITKK